jgi:hypothetical protein
MADEAPLFFERRLGGLFPANPAAEKALAAVSGRVRVKITRTQGNNKRIALYWIVLGIAAPMLDEQAPGLTDQLLAQRPQGPGRAGQDRQAAERPGDQGLRQHQLPQDDRVERAAYIDFAFKTLSSWLGVDVETLTKEAKEQAA